MGVVKKNSPLGVLGRGVRLGKLGLSLTGSYVGYQLQNLWLGDEERSQRKHRFQQGASRKVRKELGSLKGAAMKLGQLLSLQTQALPDESIQELANLQMRAPGMHPTLARAQFKSSLGKYPEDIFAEFAPEPFAAASLGQVHRAVTRQGEQVAVKIQYPAIRSTIENDFKLLRSATLPGRVTGHFPLAILNEIQRGFLEETDYVNEGKNLEFFSSGLAGFDYFCVPSVYWDLTSDRVLTMSFVEGKHLQDLLKSRPSAAVRNLIGERLVELYYHQVHRLKAIQADQHPGNFLFHPDGKIGLIDFGCVKRIRFDASELIRCCVARSWANDSEQAQHVLGLIFGQTVPPAKARTMLRALDELAGILYPRGNSSEQCVDFGEAKLLATMGRCLGTALRDKLTNPEFAFISRADLGIYSLLHQLRAKVKPAEVWRRVSKK